MLLEIDLDFCVYVRENERKRGAKKIILFGFRKCKDGEENKRNSRLKKISFFIFVLSINLFSFFFF